MCRQAKATCNQFKLSINVIDKGRITDGTWLTMIMIFYNLRCSVLFKLIESGQCTSFSGL